MKKIISTVLASTCMFCSVVSASNEGSSYEENPPKIQIEDLEQKREPKITKSHIYVSQKAFLIGLACALGIDVKIKFIADKREKNYNFKILSIDNSDFVYSDFSYKQQLSNLIVIFTAMKNLITNKPEILVEKCMLNFVTINNHVLTKSFISQLGDMILNLIYRKKIIAIKENKFNNPIDLTEDPYFQNRIKYFFKEILKPTQDNSQKIHNFYLPSIS